MIATFVGGCGTFVALEKGLQLDQKGHKNWMNLAITYLFTCL